MPTDRQRRVRGKCSGIPVRKRSDQHKKNGAARKRRSVFLCARSLTPACERGGAFATAPPDLRPAPWPLEVCRQRKAHGARTKHGRIVQVQRRADLRRATLIANVASEEFDTVAFKQEAGAEIEHGVAP